MNQVKIGKFIAQCRKNKNMTQAELAEKLNIETPISNAIYRAVYSKENSKEIFLSLMNRELKGEEEFIKK